MFLTKQRSTLVVFGPSLILLFTCVIPIRAQRAGSGAASMHDQAPAIQRADMDRLLLAPVSAKTNYNPNREALMRQVRSDFKDLQELNNKMMATAWETDTLDYTFLSDMVSRIKGKASRLKTNLQLPSSDEVANTTPVQAISTLREFRASLLVLDATIMRFVNNPVFQTPHNLEIGLATKARHDLEAVISLTTDLKKIAVRLSRTPPSP
jgi:hypothetical protein